MGNVQNSILVLLLQIIILECEVHAPGVCLHVGLISVGYIITPRQVVVAAKVSSLFHYVSGFHFGHDVFGLIYGFNRTGQQAPTGKCTLWIVVLCLYGAEVLRSMLNLRRVNS
jgi:hypothetical protein